MPKLFSQLKSSTAGNYVQALGHQLHYLRRGSGRPVVMIHGLFGSSEDFRHSIFDRVSLHYDAIAFDRPGMGQSLAGKPLTLDEQVEVLHAALVELGIRKPVLCGHSLGASLCLAYSLRFPQEAAGLLLLGAYIMPTTDPIHWIYRFPFYPVIGGFLLHTCLGLLSLLAARPIAQSVFYPHRIPKDYFREVRKTLQKPSVYRSHARDVHHFRDFLNRHSPRYGEITVPVVIVTGKDDLVAPAELHAMPLREALPRAELVLLDRTGHQPGFFRPAEIMTGLHRVWEMADHPSEKTPPKKEDADNRKWIFLKKMKRVIYFLIIAGVLGYGVLYGLNRYTTFFEPVPSPSETAEETSLPAGARRAFTFEGVDPLASWRRHEFKGQTEYRIEDSAEGEKVLHSISRGKSSALFKEDVQLPMASKPIFTWRWKVVRFPSGKKYTALNDRSENDFAGRVYAIFKGRMSITHEVIQYVWDDHFPEGTIADGFSLGNVKVKMLVLHSGPPPADGAWVTERRDLNQDFEMAFGKPAGDKNFKGFGLMTDTDNTASEAEAYFGSFAVEMPGGILSEPEAPAIAKPVEVLTGFTEGFKSGSRKMLEGVRKGADFLAAPFRKE